MIHCVKRTTAQCSWASLIQIIHLSGHMFGNQYPFLNRKWFAYSEVKLFGQSVWERRCLDTWGSTVLWFIIILCWIAFCKPPLFSSVFAIVLQTHKGIWCICRLHFHLHFHQPIIFNTIIIISIRGSDNLNNTVIPIVIISVRNNGNVSATLEGISLPSWNQTPGSISSP